LAAIQELLIFYETLRFIAVFARTLHFPYPEADTSVYITSSYLRSALILSITYVLIFLVVAPFVLYALYVVLLDLIILIILSEEY
jgi:hypothetical protein